MMAGQVHHLRNAICVILTQDGGVTIPGSAQDPVTVPGDFVVHGVWREVLSAGPAHGRVQDERSREGGRVSQFTEDPSVPAMNERRHIDFALRSVDEAYQQPRIR
jgi:hypothetical protein